jgi:hypothetical protein
MYSRLPTTVRQLQDRYFWVRPAHVSVRRRTEVRSQDNIYLSLEQDDKVPLVVRSALRTNSGTSPSVHRMMIYYHISVISPENRPGSPEACFSELSVINFELFKEIRELERRCWYVRLEPTDRNLPSSCAGPIWDRGPRQIFRRDVPG